MKTNEINDGIYQLKLGSKLVKFPIKIWDYLIIQNSIIGLLSKSDIKKLYPKMNANSCIWCFNFDGKVKWVIDAPYYIDKEGKSHLMEDPYLSMKMIDKKLRVFTGYGNSYDVDLETGKISHWEHHK